MSELVRSAGGVETISRIRCGADEHVETILSETEELTLDDYLKNLRSESSRSSDPATAAPVFRHGRSRTSLAHDRGVREPERRTRE